MSDIWSSAINAMQSRVTPQTFDLWLRPIRLVSVDDQTIRLAAPNRFMKDWFEAHYLEPVLAELREQQSRGYDVDIAVETQPVAHESTWRADTDNKPKHAGADPGAMATSGDVPANLALKTDDPPSATRQDRPIPELPEPSLGTIRPAAPFRGQSAQTTGLPAAPRFHPRYDLSAFIQGSCNELAASAAMAAAERPGTRYNRLFIYGDVGLGKTHLLQGIGRAIQIQHPQLQIAYLSAEQFMNEFVTAVRRNQFDEFRRRYRQGPDCLLIDDIQFISGRERTMDEFFHVFNALYEAGKQIVVTADRTPSEMQGMEDRVISRLNWGLVADIQRPGIETRLAIIEQKAETDHISIPQPCRLLIAQAVDSNVRELEGALLRVAASSELMNVPITEELVRRILGSALDRQGPQALGISEITKATCAYFSVRLADLKGPRRHRAVARPRMIAMFLCRELTPASYPEIGMKFGGRDHSTVINAHRRIRKLAEDDTDIASAIESLTAQLTQASRDSSAMLTGLRSRSAHGS